MMRPKTTVGKRKYLELAERLENKVRTNPRGFSKEFVELSRSIARDLRAMANAS